MNKQSWMWIGAAAVATAVAGQATAQYTATAIPPITGGFTTEAFGVNNAGVVVGRGDNMNGQVAAFVFQNGVTTELPFLAGGADAQASSINSSNVIVGNCDDASGTSRAVKWELVSGAWQITDLGTLAAGDAGFGVATRINDAGKIVGYCSVNSPGPYHACLWDGATKSDLGTLGYTGNLAYSQALGINEAGEVSGYAYRVLGGPEHGMIVTDRGGIDITPMEQFGLAQWHNVNSSGILGGYISSNQTAGEFRPATFDRSSGDGFVLLPLIDGLVGGYGYDINDAGQVVGVNFLLSPNPAESIFHGFVFDGGVTRDLNDISSGLPGTFAEARDISNDGKIVGTAETPVGFTAVLLTPPAPCPSDFNRDGSTTVQDIFDFLTAYFGADPAADVNNDSSVTVQDIFDFLNIYFAGCT